MIRLLSLQDISKCHVTLRERSNATEESRIFDVRDPSLSCIALQRTQCVQVWLRMTFLR
jgi:hypothetical protein